MERLKKFLVALIILTLIISTLTFAAGSKVTIEVLLNSINLTVNGKKVDADTIVYQGTTYVPLRATAEMLGKEVGWNQETQTASIDDKKAKKEEITLDQIPYEIVILEPNSIGMVYMEATYKNNTKLPILSYDATVLLKDKNEKTYLTTFDTVMPGETSPKFETFGPETQDKKDIEILETEVRLDLGNGKYLLVHYDHKLNRYTYNEYNN